MIYRIIIQPPAGVDIDEAVLWISRSSPESASKWLDGLEGALQSLQKFPTRCPLAEESKAFAIDVRQLIYGKRTSAYRILFTVVNDSVRILHVRHGRRERLKKL